jgi:hypothetical protein
MTRCKGWGLPLGNFRKSRQVRYYIKGRLSELGLPKSILRAFQAESGNGITKNGIRFRNQLREKFKDISTHSNSLGTLTGKKECKTHICENKCFKNCDET